MAKLPAFQDDQEVLASKVREAWYDGRPIVPIIGAGMSAESGIPTIASVVRYMAKLHSLLSNRQLPPLRERTPLDLTGPLLSIYAKNIPRFLRENGWPDRFQLNEDLRQVLSESNATSLNDEIRKSLTILAKRLNPGGHHALMGYFTATQTFSNSNNTGESPEFSILSDWKPLLREFTGFNSHLADSLFANLSRRRLPSLPHRYLAFLARLLAVRTIFTFNFDPLIEHALIGEAISHRVFAMHQGRELPPRVLLGDDVAIIKMHGDTHDLLLDERLDHELPKNYKETFLNLTGQKPLLFVLGCSGHDRRLCDLLQHSITHADASILWCRFGQRADTPFDLHTIRLPRKTKELQKKRATYNVITFNDCGLLLSSLYQHLTYRFPSSSQPYALRIIRPRFAPVETDAETMPTATPSQAITVFDGWGKVDIVQHVDWKAPILSEPSKNQFAFLASKSYQEYIAPPGYIKAMRYTSTISSGYVRIWIELENYYSLGDVVAEIINQCRGSDVELTPPLFPVGTPGHSPEELPPSLDHPKYDALLLTPANAAARVYRALCRSRYLLVFDGLDAFHWQFSTHHGTTRKIEAAIGPMKDLCKFLRELAKLVTAKGRWSAGDSHIVISLDKPRTRHSGDEIEQESLVEFAEEFRKGLRGLLSFVPHSSWNLCDETRPVDNAAETYLSKLTTLLSRREVIPRSSDQNIIFALSCMRRTRHLVAVRELLAIFDRESSHVPGGLSPAKDVHLHNKLKLYTDCGLLRPLEGAGYGMTRSLRNAIYDAYTNFTSPDRQIQNCPPQQAAGSSGTPPTRNSDVGNSISQMLVAMLTHDVLAEYYSSTAFLPSLDATFLLEFTYHRISSLRFAGGILRTLAHWASAPSTSEGGAESEEKPSVELAARQAAYAQRLPRAVEKKLGDFTLWPKLLGEHLPTDESSLLESINRCREKFRTEPLLILLQYRKNLLDGLAKTWQRHASVIREQLPTDRVIAVCEVLRRHDIGEHLLLDPAIAPEAEKEAARMGKAWMESGWTLSDISDSRALDDLASELRTMEAKCHYERGGYAGLISLRWNYLELKEGGQGKKNSDKRDSNEANGATFLDKEYWAGKFKQWQDRAVPQEGEFGPAAGKKLLSDLHYWLDIAVSLHWLGFSLGRKAGDRIGKAVGELLEQVRKCAIRLHGFVGSGELGARLSFITIERALSKYSPMGSCEHVESPANRGGDAVTEHSHGVAEAAAIMDQCDEALQFLRKNDLSTGANWFSPFLNPTSDRTVFVLYTALLHILRGRAAALASTRKNDVRLLHRAFADFEAARSGVSTRNRLILAWADLGAAEVSLGWAEAVFEMAGRREHGEREKMEGVAWAKLGSARGYLRQSVSRLVATSGNILMWRYFHWLAARYHTARIWIAFGRLIEGAKLGAFEAGRGRSTSVRVSQLVSRTGKALATLSAGLDYTHPNAHRFVAAFREIWWSSLLCSFGLGIVSVADGIRRGCIKGVQLDSNRLVRTLCAYWFAMNRSAGILVDEGTVGGIVSNLFPRMFSLDFLQREKTTDMFEGWRSWMEVDLDSFERWQFRAYGSERVGERGSTGGKRSLVEECLGAAAPGNDIKFR